MIEIRNFPIRTQFSEITVGEFDEIIKLINDPKKPALEKYIRIFKLMGGTDDIVDELTFDELIEFIKNLGNDNNQYNPVPEKIEIDGEVYKIHNGEIKIFARDLVPIEAFIKKESIFSASFALSILLKKDTTEKIDHYNKKHIEEKRAKIKSLPVLVFLPLIIYLTESLGQKLNLLNATPNPLS
jgi:hypothetical protein